MIVNSILFHIFVVLIGFNMTTKENINVPGATAIPTLRVETDKPFAEGTSYFTTMKMIEDLGMQYPCEKSKTKQHFGIFECSRCGKPFRSALYSINGGYTKSCGCVGIQKVRDRMSKHGLYKHPLYHVWAAMKQRCLNPKNIQYIEWGGRGITICPEWISDFVLFFNWAMNNGYQHGLRLDRENNDGAYSPENCRWVDDFDSKVNIRIIKSNNTTGYRCVKLCKQKNFKKWQAELTHRKKKYSIGFFYTAIEAARAYNNFVIVNNFPHPLNKI